MTKEQILFESVLRSGPVTITDVAQRDNITYFKANSHQYGTYADKVMHEHHHMYDCPVTKMWAAEEHEPEAMTAKAKMLDSINDDLDLWWRHRLDVFKIVFPLALKIMLEKGDDEFLKFVDDHFCITAEPGADAIITRLENKCS